MGTPVHPAGTGRLCPPLRSDCRSLMEWGVVWAPLFFHLWVLLCCSNAARFPAVRFGASAVVSGPLVQTAPALVFTRDHPQHSSVTKSWAEPALPKLLDHGHPREDVEMLVQGWRLAAFPWLWANLVTPVSTPVSKLGLLASSGLLQPGPLLWCSSVGGTRSTWLLWPNAACLAPGQGFVSQAGY